MKLRQVTIQDADVLLEWRNDDETRKASHNTEKVSRASHVEWLSKSLKNNNRKLFIAEENNIAVGTVRTDLDEGVWEISWTTAPDARGRKVAQRMVKIVIKEIKEPIRAEIKTNNIASIKVAERAGLEFSHTTEGVAHYVRPATEDLV